MMISCKNFTMILITKKMSLLILMMVCIISTNAQEKQGKNRGDKKKKEWALQTANYVTYYLQDDNRNLTIVEHGCSFWYRAYIGVVGLLNDFQLENQNQETETNGL